MRFGAAFWTNRTDWPAVRDACLAAERAGFDSLWLDDHLLADEGDWRDAKLEGWTALAALAVLTSRPRLGLLVAANTFRNPGLTAKLATTLDHLSNGRFILGIGGGWFEREHEAFGLDFGAGFGERLDRLEEAVGLIERLLAGGTVTHEGPAYRLHEALVRPLPVQQRLPILIGGSGRRKTLRTAALHADLWNGYGEADRIAETSAALRGWCDELGRPFGAIERTITLDVVIRDTVLAAETVLHDLEIRHGVADRLQADGTPAGPGACGDPATVARYLHQFAELGVAEAIWVFRAPFDLETIARLDEVRASLAGVRSTGA